MALFDTGNAPGGKPPQNLADVLGQQAQTASSGIQDQYAQARKRLIGQQAAMGRVGGVSDYPLTDLDREEGTALSGVQNTLQGSLGQIPVEDWLNSQKYNQSLNLTDLIASLSKPSTLEEALGGLGAGLKIGGAAAAAFGG